MSTKKPVQVVFHTHDFDQSSELWKRIDRWFYASPGDQSGLAADYVEEHIKNLIQKYVNQSI